MFKKNHSWRISFKTIDIDYGRLKTLIKAAFKSSAFSGKVLPQTLVLPCVGLEFKMGHIVMQNSHRLSDVIFFLHIGIW